MMIETMRVGNKMLVLDGKSKLGYFDLVTRTYHEYEEPGERIPVRVYKEIKPGTVITNLGGKQYIVTTL